MRSLERNKQKIYFANVAAVTRDNRGNDVYSYETPQLAEVNISSPTGGSQGTVNGILLSYDYQIIVSPKEFAELNFTENKTRVWYNNTPNEAADNYDLNITLIAKSINEVRIGLKRK